MTFNDFFRLRLDATEFTNYEMFLMDCGGSVAEQDLPLLKPIYKIRNFRDLRKFTKLTQEEFAKEYRFSKKTIENWDKNNPPPNVFDLIFYAVLMDSTAD